MSTYHFVVDQAGQLLGADATFSADADDSRVWHIDGDSLRNPASGITVSLDADGCAVLGDGRKVGVSLVVVDGPEQLPSVHLAELREQGMTVINNVIDPTEIASLKDRVKEERARNHGDEAPTDGHFWITTALLWSPELARASSHPLALWLLRQYLDTSDIHYCHQPIITTLKPAGKLLGRHPKGGWHSDYPYHPGVFPDDNWPVSPVLGAQFNVCIDPFLPETAGTQYVPGSHKLCEGPSKAFNTEGTVMGEGVHTNVRQIVAPAGSAVIYDARTWHRACYELNVSGRDRMAILNAVAPSWVLPMIDKVPITEGYRAANVSASLNQRERDEIERLCHTPTLTRPEGMPALRSRS